MKGRARTCRTWARRSGLALGRSILSKLKLPVWNGYDYAGSI
jgi:hypothetical protein